MSSLRAKAIENNGTNSSQKSRLALLGPLVVLAVSLVFGLILAIAISYYEGEQQRAFESERLTKTLGSNARSLSLMLWQLDYDAADLLINSLAEIDTVEAIFVETPDGTIIGTNIDEPIRVPFMTMALIYSGTSKQDQRVGSLRLYLDEA